MSDDAARLMAAVSKIMAQRGSRSLTIYKDERYIPPSWIVKHGRFTAEASDMVTAVEGVADRVKEPA